VQEDLAVNANLILDLDVLTRSRNDRLDQRRKAAGTQTPAKIATRTRRAHGVGIWCTHEDKVIDLDLAIERQDAPDAKGYTRGEIDPEPCGAKTNHPNKHRRHNGAQ
jgi:hypothetical protein